MSNIVSIVMDVPTTTSIAIAEGVELQHKNVIDLVRKYVDDLGVFGGVAFKILPFETAGGTQSREVAMLNEQQATLLITYMRNSDVVRQFKIRLVEEFYSARNQTPNMPTTFVEALRLAADKAEQVELLEHQAEIDAPKVAFHDRITVTHKMMQVGDAAKLMKVKPRFLFKYLRDKKWLFKNSGRAMQTAVNAGWMVTKIGTRPCPIRGEADYITPYVTGLGYEKLENLLTADGHIQQSAPDNQRVLEVVE